MGNMFRYSNRVVLFHTLLIIGRFLSSAGHIFVDSKG